MVKVYGTWIYSAQKYEIINNILYADLRKINGKWNRDSIKFELNKPYCNNNGNFGIESSLHFMLLNMEKSKDRYEYMKNQLDNINCSYQRIDAIDGNNLENNEFVKELCKKDRIGIKMGCNESNEKWYYDGTPHTLMTGLHKNAHCGYKGLTLSNLKAFNEVIYREEEWICIIEDDAVINREIYNRIISFLNKYDKSNLDVIVLDRRGLGGTSCVIYNKRIISQLLKDLHPLSEYTLTFEDKFKRVCLWDWFLYTYIKNMNIKYKCFRCIESGIFKSTIS